MVALLTGIMVAPGQATARAKPAVCSDDTTGESPIVVTPESADTNTDTPVLSAVLETYNGVGGLTGSLYIIDSAGNAVGGTPTDLFAFSDNPTLRKLLGGGRADAAEMYERASPVSYVDPGDAPMFLYHGRHDWIVDVSQAREMFEALRDAGVPAEYHESVLGHAVTFLFDDEDMQLAIKFLDRWLKEDGAEPER